MASKKIVRVKKKGSTVLSPKRIIISNGAKVESNPSHTIKVVDDEDLNADLNDDSNVVTNVVTNDGIDDAIDDALDNAASGVVELNSSSIKDPVEQVPLHPENAEDSPQLDLTQDLSEPTFKFFCYRCGQKLKVPISWANLSTACGNCGHDLVVPPPIAGEGL